MFRLRYLAFFLFLLHPGPAPARQVAIEIVSPTQAIPRDSYKTWSLFLVCTPDWVTPEKSQDLANLYRRFRSFGAAIGNDNLAVWFWRRQTSLDDPMLSDNVDVARSAEFCRVLEKRPSEGPFLVITSAYPDLDAFPDERAVFELGALQPSELAGLLNTLTDELLLDGRVSPERPAAASSTTASAAAAPGADAGFWMRLLEGFRRSMIGFGCRLKMQIHTGLLTAELRECPGA